MKLILSKTHLKRKLLRVLKKRLRGWGYELTKFQQERQNDAISFYMDIDAKQISRPQFKDLITFLEQRECTGITIQHAAEKLPKLGILASHEDNLIAVLAEFLTHHGGKRNLDMVSLTNALKKTREQSVNIMSADGKSCFRFILELWKTEASYYEAPTANHISRRLWKTTAVEHNVWAPGHIPDYQSILTHPPSSGFDFPVDLVFTWVNADDLDWQALYQTHAIHVGSQRKNFSRFHNRDELKYALRSWDQFGEFIRKIFIVSNCAPPPWLNVDHPAVTWVSHEEIFPADALPTFNSHAIESLLHKIPGLSTHFIYSNDDLMLTRRASVEDYYFPNGMCKPQLEAYGMVSGRPVAGQPDYLNGARNANALLEPMFKRTPTQLAKHSPHPLRKDLMGELETHFEAAFARTAYSKFRHVEDVAVTAYLHAHYGILSGRAVASDTPVKLIQQNHEFEELFADLIAKRQAGADVLLPLSICINDGQDSHLNVVWNRSVVTFLNTFYPHKSSFER